MIHSNSVKNHKIEAWTYANAAARTGASGFTSADLGKLAYQTDNATYWRLTATTPTWIQAMAGPAGANGAAGAAGPGVPTGGTAAQVLAKIDGADYNTGWVDPPVGGGGGAQILGRYFADVATTGTSGSLQSLFTTSVASGLIANDGDVIRARYGLVAVGHATANRKFAVTIDGGSLLDTSDISDLLFPAGGVANGVEIEVTLVRLSNSTFHYTVRFTVTNDPSFGVTPTPSIVKCGNKTGMNLALTAFNLILKAAAYGTGAASGDITAKLGYVEYLPNL